MYSTHLDFVRHGVDCSEGKFWDKPWYVFFSSAQRRKHKRTTQVAMEKTVKNEFLVHSLHAYFLLAGDSRKKILYTVERIHDGRSFCRRRVTGKQDNRAIFVVTASFKTAESEPKLEYQIPSTQMLSLLSYFDVPRGGTSDSLPKSFIVPIKI